VLRVPVGRDLVPRSTLVFRRWMRAATENCHNSNTVRAVCAALGLGKEPNLLGMSEAAPLFPQHYFKSRAGFVYDLT